MAEGDAQAATAEAPAEEQEQGKLALLSLRGIGLVALLLLAEALALMLVVRSMGGIDGSAVEVPTAYIPFDKVSAKVYGPNQQRPVFYALKAELEVEAAYKEELTKVVNATLKPMFIDRIMSRMAQVAPASQRQMGLDKLRGRLKQDVQAIFNRELLKIPKYQKMYKEDIEKYKAMKKDPRQAHKAVQPGPIKDVVFTEFSF